MEAFPIPYLAVPATDRVRVKPHLEQALRAGAHFMDENLKPIRTEKDMLNALVVGGVGLALKKLLTEAESLTQ